MIFRFLEVSLIHLHSLEIHFFVCFMQLVTDMVSLLYVSSYEDVDGRCCGNQRHNEYNPTEECSNVRCERYSKED